MLLGPERAGMSQEAVDAHYGIKRTTWADRERRRKRLSKRISQAEDKQAVVAQLRNDPAAALEQLRDRSPARGRAYAVRRAFVTEHGGLRPGVIIEIAGDPGDYSPFIMALEPGNDGFEKCERRSYEILFVP